MSEHPIHPWYGPCDGFADGECQECRRFFRELSECCREVIAEFGGSVPSDAVGQEGVDVIRRLQQLLEIKA